MRHTRSHTANRRSHHAVKTPDLAVCKNCGSQHRPHHMCLECGFYKGKIVLDLAAKKKDREARIKAKREAKKGEETEEEASEPNTAQDDNTKEAEVAKEEKAK